MTSIFHQFMPADKLLQSAIKAFEEWRMSRKGRCPIPEDLWRLTPPLTRYFSPTQIAKHLRLNGSQLKSQLARLTGAEANSMQWVECTQQISMLSASSDSTGESTCSLEFDCKRASSVKLRGLTIHELEQIVSLLVSETPCYN